MVWNGNDDERVEEMKLCFQMFIMTLGGFGDIWEEIHETQYIMIGES